MRIAGLDLYNLRCHKRLCLHPVAGLNLLLGPNGCGKTTVLEGVMLLATGRSPRTGWSRELIRRGEDQAAVRGTLGSAAGREQQVEVALSRSGGNGAQRRILLEGAPPASLADLMQRVPAVYFAPQDLGLIQGGARERRRFLNAALAGMRPLYLGDLLRYRRAVRQRNALLRLAAQGRARGEDLAPWTAQMVRAGAQIMADREWLVQQLAPRAAELYRLLSADAEPLQIRYRPQVDCSEQGLPERSEALYQALEETAERELRCGATQIGPQRDELVVLLGERRARDYASQGQQRTAALSLKLAQAQVLAGVRGEPPVVLLDDCLSELDERRRRQVLELVGEFEQIVLTSAGDCPQDLGASVAQVVELPPPGAEEEDGRPAAPPGPAEEGADRTEGEDGSPSRLNGGESEGP